MARASLSTDDLAGRSTEPHPRDPDPSEVDVRDEGRHDADARDPHRHDADEQGRYEPDVREQEVDAADARDPGRDDERVDGSAPRHADPSDEPQQVQYTPLLRDREAGVFLDRWRDVQARFVDDPQAAVRDADALVAELMQSLAQRFSEQKGALQETWDGGGQPETEQLRQALQEYRSFFERLLST